MAGPRSIAAALGDESLELEPGELVMPQIDGDECRVVRCSSILRTYGFDSVSLFFSVGVATPAAVSSSSSKERGVCSSASKDVDDLDPGIGTRCLMVLIDSSVLDLLPLYSV